MIELIGRIKARLWSRELSYLNKLPGDLQNGACLYPWFDVELFILLLQHSLTLAQNPSPSQGWSLFCVYMWKTCGNQFFSFYYVGPSNWTQVIKSSFTHQSILLALCSFMSCRCIPILLNIVQISFLSLWLSHDFFQSWIYIYKTITVISKIIISEGRIAYRWSLIFFQIILHSINSAVWFNHI